MMKFFTSIVTSCKDIAGKLRRVNAFANGIDVENRQLMQQFGFVSVPKQGSRILFLQFGNVTIGVASDGSERPDVKEGEVAVYVDKDNYILLKQNGSIEIKAPKGVDIDGDLRVTKDIWDNTSNPADVGSVNNMRQILKQQVHGTAVGPSSPGTPPIIPNPPPAV